MKNRELAQMFANGETEGEGSHMFIKDNAIYSYGYHFPISVRLSNGLDDVYLFVEEGYSQTTSKHKNYVQSAIRGEIVFVSISKLKMAIEKNIKTMKEFVAEINY